MKNSRIFLPLSALAMAIGGLACEDDVSPIGGSITKGEASISIDTTIFNLDATPVINDRYDARSGALMLGNITVPEYGDLNCSFVTRLLCATNVPVADTIPEERIDSCLLSLYVGSLNYTGSSSAPQQLEVYRLEKQIPSDIDNNFVPTPGDYYNPRMPLGKKSYTVSNLALSDSLQSVTTGVTINVKMPDKMAKDIFREYKENPQIFQWPETFAKEYLPGLYVKSTFGNGCLANISSLRVSVFYHDFKTTTKVEDGDTIKTTTPDIKSVVVFSNAPEVLSSNHISYVMSDNIKDRVAAGETIITTPGGYEAKFNFPAQEIIDKYKDSERNLSIVGGLSMSIPAESVENDFGLGIAPYMLIIKTSEVEKFFAENKIPDNKTSFYAKYDSTNKRYYFSSLRSYFLDLLAKEEITDDDTEMSIIPVLISTEDVQSGYNTVTYVTQCVPYTYYPTMTRLDTKNTEIVFTFSSQVID
ncbi:MAG: DUF4270 domain-containing protein [Muribaculaceae bacterium]|nr:DUF4270 domain-containing protein [Muribaculaceae bacterium]